MTHSDRAVESFESSELTRALFTEAGDALLLVEPSSERLLDVNPMALKLTRLSAEELLSLPLREVLRHEQGTEDWLRRARETATFHGQDGFLLRTTQPDGWTPVSVSISRLHPPGEPPLALFAVHDRSEQAAAYRRQHRTEAELRRVLVSVSDCLWSCRVDAGGRWRYRYLSPVVQRITGYPVPYFVEDTLTWSRLVEPEDRARWTELREQAAAGRSGEIEYRIRRADGSTAWVRESVTAGPAEDGFSGLLVHGVLTDVTERRRAEQTAQEARLLETQKLESLSVLAGGVAHDFNNLLTGILGNAGLARLHCPPGSPALGPLEQIETIAGRAGDLCRQMLAYAGRGRMVLESVPLNPLLRETVDVLRTSVSARVQLQLELGDGLPSIRADASQVRQVVMNLVVNSAEAIGEREGRIVIRTRRAAPEDWDAGSQHPSEQSARDAICLEVNDDGAGMTPEVRARIFEPFFTTKFTGRGLGLAAVLGIVRAHSGALRVESAPGAGTSFRILLPAASAGAAPVDEAAPPRGDGILVVDDEATIRDVAGRLLEKAGFRALKARDGWEAVQWFRRYGSEARLVLLDLTMPHLNGEQTLRELRKLRPDIPVVLMSGYAEPEVTARFADHKVSGFVQKPFRAQDLMAAVQRALAESEAP
jgi:PAS domain S-box-containing protein